MKTVPAIMLEQWLTSILGHMEADDPGYLCGRSGRRGRSLTISADDCVDGNPVRELLERSLQKLAEGYHLEALTPLTN